MGFSRSIRSIKRGRGWGFLSYGDVVRVGFGHRYSLGNRWVFSSKSYLHSRMLLTSVDIT